jgi:hypothetical protein
MQSLKICAIHWMLLEGIEQNGIDDNVARMGRMKMNVTVPWLMQCQREVLGSISG